MSPTTLPSSRLAMIASAEAIAVESGFGALTLTEVQTRAGQRNKSAARYHFGSFDGLIEAVIDHRMGPVNVRRREMLQALPETASLRDLVAALVVPLAEQTVLRPGSRYARFLAQAMVDPVQADLLRDHLRADSLREVLDRIESAVGLPHPLTRRRFTVLIGMVVMSLATWEGHGEPLPDARELINDLLGMCLATVQAPLPHDGSTT